MIRQMKSSYFRSSFLIALASAENMSAEVEADYVERYRPQFHFTPPTGWMGEPSGLVYEDGLYHLFYWGHPVRRDLVRWEHWSRALTNENGVAVMSGSAVVDLRNTSGFGTVGEPPMVGIYSSLHQADRRQTRDLAYSNDGGRSWSKYSGNPVIDISSTEFQDLQFIWYEPDRHWIKLVAPSAETKVRYYASPDLKHRTQLSDSGPKGATDSVRECPNLFLLLLEANPKHTKWILKVDVQPTGGQDFVGDFDGRAFTVEKDWLGQLKTNDWESEGTLFADFEGDDYGSWKTTGKAFGSSPAHGQLEDQKAMTGFRGGRLVNSFHGGDDALGTLTSPLFTLSKPNILFLIGGGDHSGPICINLLGDGKVVRTQVGRNSEALRWTSWDVREFMTRPARIQIVDQQTGEWGHINVEQIVFSVHPVDLGRRMSARWFDYGDDFYAARSWHGVPSSDHRRIWIAWMGNWLYAKNVQTAPWKGMQSIPCELSLKLSPAGQLDLVRQPICEPEQLRLQCWRLPATPFGPGELSMSKEGIRRKTLEIMAEFEGQGATELGLKIQQGADEETVTGYEVASPLMFGNQTHSDLVNFNPNFPARHLGALSPGHGQIHLHVFMDNSSIEVFGGNGRTVISDQIFPEPASDRLAVDAHGGSVRLRSLKVWRLGSVNPQD